MSQYDEPEEGEWVRPKPTGFKHACCDCGLVHRMDFRVVDGHVEFRVWAAPRSTAQMRRHMVPAWMRRNNKAVQVPVRSEPSEEATLPSGDARVAAL